MRRITPSLGAGIFILAAIGAQAQTTCPLDPVTGNAVAQMISPPDGSTLPAGAVTFEWCNANADYFLSVESVPGAHDIFFAFVGGVGPGAGMVSLTLGPACASAPPTGCILANGETIYVTLWTLKHGQILPPSPFQYTYAAASPTITTTTTQVTTTTTQITTSTTTLSAGGCTSNSECDDGNSCTQDQCTDGQCIYRPLGGGVGAECELAEAGGLACSPKLQSTFTQKLAKARAAIGRAAMATTAKKKAKAKAAASAAVQAIAKKAARFTAKGKIPAACAQQIADTMRRLQQAIAAI